MRVIEVRVWYKFVVEIMGKNIGNWWFLGNLIIRVWVKGFYWI